MNPDIVNPGLLKIFWNSNEIKCKLWLCLPAVVTSVFDSVVTLLGQPSAYWGGQFNQVNEFNPIAHFALTTHPLAYLVYSLLKYLLVSMLIILLPLNASKVFATAWTIGSAKAIYNWLAGVFHMGYWISNLALFIPAIILVYAFEKCERRKNT